VLSTSQTAGLVMMAVAVALAGGAAPAWSAVLIAGASGMVQTGAIGAYYKALSTGAMGVVAPISATAALVPLTVGLIEGERPSSAQWLGIVFAVAGVMAAGYQPSRVRLDGRRIALGVGMALLAAVGIGSFFTLISIAADRADLLWVVLVNRIVAVTMLLGIFLLLRDRWRSSGNPALSGLARLDLIGVITIGVLALGATVLFSAATTHGLLSIVSVIGALYPVTTVLIARVVLREQIHLMQRAGATLALIGVALVSS
jgi:drug/metabolite transporter (DMT)-like permease